MYIQINIIRYLVLISSLLALACHIVQCTLFSNYIVNSNNIISSSTKHWQCLTWYILLGFSIVSSIALCVQTCFKRGHLLRCDKILGYINCFAILAVMLVTIFFSTPKESAAMGPMAHCYLTDQQENPMYSVLFKRCLLLDSTWILSIVMCCLWIALLLCVHFIEYKRHDSSKNKYTCCPPSSTSCSDKTDVYSLTGNNEDHFKNDHCFVPASMENANVNKFDLPFAPHTEKLEIPDNNMIGGESDQALFGRAPLSSSEQCYYQIPQAAVNCQQEKDNQWYPKHYPYF